MAAQAVLNLLNGRCGDSERAHDALKNGLAGGTMPSGRFGANAAWWLAALLAHNLHTLTAWWSLNETSPGQPGSGSAVSCWITAMRRDPKPRAATLLQDDREQTERASAVFDAAKTVLITDVVLAEAVWTLSGRKYGLAKAELVAAIERLFSEPNIRFEDDQVVWRALQAYRCVGSAGEPRPVKGAGFADALIVFKALRTASDAGETLTDVYTFDTAMQRLPHTASP